MLDYLTFLRHWSENITRPYKLLDLLENKEKIILFEQQHNKSNNNNITKSCSTNSKTYKEN